MPVELNKSLEECEVQARALIKEMHQYKAAKELHQRSAAALDATSVALNRVVQEIKPLTSRRLLLFWMFQMIAWAITTLLVIAMFILMLLKKA